MDPATVASLCTLGAVFLGFAWQMIRDSRQMYRENRQRQWDIEDRAMLAKKVEESKETLAVKVEDSKQHLSGKVKDAEQVGADANAELKELIKENTKISEAAVKGIEETKKVAEGAFHEANTVNQKLEKLGLAHNTQGAEQTAAVEQLTAAVKANQDPKP